MMCMVRLPPARATVGLQLHRRLGVEHRLVRDRQGLVRSQAQDVGEPRADQLLVGRAVGLGEAGVDPEQPTVQVGDVDQRGRVVDELGEPALAVAQPLRLRVGTLLRRAALGLRPAPVDDRRGRAGKDEAGVEQGRGQGVLLRPRVVVHLTGRVVGEDAVLCQHHADGDDERPPVLVQRESGDHEEEVEVHERVAAPGVHQERRCGHETHRDGGRGQRTGAEGGACQGERCEPDAALRRVLERVPPGQGPDGQHEGVPGQQQDERPVPRAPQGLGERAPVGQSSCQATEDRGSHPSTVARARTSRHAPFEPSRGGPTWPVRLVAPTLGGGRVGRTVAAPGARSSRKVRAPQGRVVGNTDPG